MSDPENFPQDILENSGVGIYAHLDAEDKYLDAKSKLLRVQRSIKRCVQGYEIAVRIKNVFGRALRVYSIVVCDFLIPRRWRVSEVLEHGWLSCSDTRFRSVGKFTKRNRIFLRRDQNQLSFEEKYGSLKGSIVSEWFTVLRAPKGSFVIGAITTGDQFSQVFIRQEKRGVRIRVTCQFDDLEIKDGEEFISEKIAILSGQEPEVLVSFAQLVAKSMEVGKISPPITGLCCSYYWRGNFVTEDIVKQELVAIASLPKRLNFDYIQIDAGYCTSLGDWLDYEERFPNGLRDIVARINKRGYKAGIWIAPFLADSRSRLFKAHQDWFLRNEKGKLFEARATSPFDNAIPIWKFRACDPTNKGYLKYLRKVLTYFVDCGFELLKIDFLYPVCLSTNYSVRATRARALRSGVKFIRDVVGEKVHLLSAIDPISPLVGLVDSARMGGDTLEPYSSSMPLLRSVVNNQMLERNLRNCKIREFFNNVIWTCDPDCLVFRERTGIRKCLIGEHKKFALENKLALWIGDSVASMDTEKRNELCQFFNR